MAKVHRLRPLKPGHPFVRAGHTPYYYASSPIIRYYFYRRLDDILTLLQDRDALEDVALDLGCFVGLLTISLLEGHRLCVGVDIDPEYLAMARQLSEYEGRASACFVQADVSRLPFKQGSIGTVTGASIFEHLPDGPDPFDEIQRVLQPGGVFVAGLPIEIGFPFLIKQLFFRLVGWPRQNHLALSEVWATFFYGDTHGPQWDAGHLDYNWRRTMAFIRARFQIEREKFWPMHWLGGLAAIYVTIRAQKEHQLSVIERLPVNN